MVYVEDMVDVEAMVEIEAMIWGGNATIEWQNWEARFGCSLLIRNYVRRTFKHYHVIYLPYRFLKGVKEMWLCYDFTSSRSERSKILRCSLVIKKDRFQDISFTRPLSLCYVEIMIYWNLLKVPEMFPSENW